MKILYITFEDVSLHKGSIVHVTETIVRLKKLGHQVGLAAHSINKFEKVDSFYNLHYSIFHSLKFLRGKKYIHYFISSIFLFFFLFKILHRYDIIYVREYYITIIAFLPRLIFGKKLVFEINGLASEEERLKGYSIFNRILASLIQRAENIATACSDKIVSVTPQIATYLIYHFNCHPNKVEVIGNGVDTEKFRPIRDETLLRPWKEKLGIENEEMVMAFVGNLARWQGVGILIESAIRLLSRGEKLKLLIIGDGPLRKDLTRRVLESGFAKEFIFTGMMGYEDIPLLINLADICAAPFILRRNQITGVSPIKVFEYMACGKPVIASRIEGLEFIESEGVGRLIEPENVKSFEEAIRDLLENSQKRENMGRKGVQIANDRFNWDSKVAKIEKVLKELA